MSTYCFWFALAGIAGMLTKAKKSDSMLSRKELQAKDIAAGSLLARTPTKAKILNSMMSCKGVMGKNIAAGSLLAGTPDKGKKKSV